MNPRGNPPAASDPTATATATITDGQVSAVTVTNGGSNYTSAPCVAFVTDGSDGVGAAAAATVFMGSVTGINLITGGLNYTAPPAVRITLKVGAALLNYRILPNPNPLQIPQSASDVSTLTLIISNGGPEIVNCSAICITLAGPGENAQDLTNTQNGIGVIVPVDENKQPLWSATQSGLTFTLTPSKQASIPIGSSSVTFLLDNIHVNSQPGACMVRIEETASTATQPSGVRNVPPIQLDKWPSQFSISGPTANQTTVGYDGSTEVFWSVNGQGVSTMISYSPDGQEIVNKPVANVGTLPVDHLTNPHGVVFTLTASFVIAGSSKTITEQRQITVAIIPAPKVDFSITPDDVHPGNPVTFKLAWTVVDVTNFQITANDDPGGRVHTLQVPFSPSGTWTVEPKDLNVEYVLTVLSTTALESQQTSEENTQ